MTKTVAEKMGVKENMRSLLINAPESALGSMELPPVQIEIKLDGEFDYIHLFVITQKGLHRELSKLKKYLKDTGSLWVSWPKSGKLSTDLNIKSVIQIGYDCGLVESKCLSVDSTWSALKFTHPKKGKIYNNSYGKLKSEISNEAK